MRRFNVPSGVFVLVVALAVGVTACGSGGGDLAVGDGWARASASMQNAGAGYMVITGGDSADQLVGVTVDSSVAAMAELHETSMIMSDDGSDMMTMKQVSSISIPANGEVPLEPGGYHVMMMNLTEPLVVGSEFVITLTFENAGDIDITVEVRDE
jgi:hypothetical protein